MKKLLLLILLALGLSAEAQQTCFGSSCGSAASSTPATGADVANVTTCTDSVGTDAWACSPASCAATLGATTPPVVVTVGTANTGAATFAFCGAAAKAVVRPVSASVSTALATGDVLSGQKIYLAYSVANDNWQMSSVSAVPLTITAGTTATSGCTAGGFLYSSSSLIACDTALVKGASYLTGTGLGFKTVLSTATGAAAPTATYDVAAQESGNASANYYNFISPNGFTGAQGFLFSAATRGLGLFQYDFPTRAFQFYPDGGTLVMKIITTGITMYRSPVYASTAPAVSNTSANSCGTTSATIAGTAEVGRITVGATSGTSCTLTFAVAAPTARECWARDNTTGLYLPITASSTTVSVVTGTFGAGDILAFGCSVY